MRDTPNETRSTPKPNRTMQEVKIVSDGDHTYIIPACVKQEFSDLLFEAELTGDISKFTEWFGKYRKNPDDLKLYTDEI